MPATPDDAVGVPDEDAKLLTLARAARARTGGREGAAVRDGIGRTYVAASVDLPSLRLSAVQAAIAAAVSSGADRVEAVAVVGVSGDLDATDRAVLDDLTVATVVLAGEDGTVRSSPSAGQ